MRFGISTHLYHDATLSREHLATIAAHEFEAIELFATRTHVDYHDAHAVAQLGGWLRETGLTLHSVHAPIASGFAGGAWGQPYSNAAEDPAERRRAVDEALAALAVARVIPYRFLVLHLGVPRGVPGAPVDRADAARRSVEDLIETAASLGVTLALEVIPNALSTPDALVRLIEEDVEPGAAGICLDYGHAHMLGDVVDAIETVSGHQVTTHIHDNGGRSDEHLPPFEGNIDWASALIATQKVGYDGTFMLEVAGAGAPDQVLARTRHSRTRLGELLA